MMGERGINSEARKQKEDWVIKWLRENPGEGGASALNSKFNDDFYERFGGTRRAKLWGAQPVARAMTILKLLHKQGRLERTTTTLGDTRPAGMPYWVYEYHLPQEKKPHAK